MENCSFCRIVAGLDPAEVVFETGSTLAFFPLEPATRGHTMVIPKRHVDSFLDLAEEDVPELGASVLHVGRALRAVLAPEGMNLITSSGEAASQSVEHVHIHLVPRWQGDPVGEIWPLKQATPEPIIENIADRIREYCQTQSLDDRNNK